MHVINSAGAKVYGSEIDDVETQNDIKRLKKYSKELKDYGCKDVRYEIGYGNTVKALTEIINKAEADVAVFGSHGHRGLKDIIFGVTANRVKDRISIPVLIAK